MGDPKVHPRRQFERPRKPWDKARIEEEKKLKELYGLKNKREIWKAKTIIRAKRKNARDLLAMPSEKRAEKEREIIDSLVRLAVLNKGATLDDVLTLTVSDLMERRLQTVVWRKGLANTVKQARQFIVHGHIAINGKKVSVPSYLVSRDQEEMIGFYGKPIPLEEKKIKVKAVKEKAESSKAIKEKFEEVKKAAEELEKEEALGSDVSVSAEETMKSAVEVKEGEK